MSALSDLLNSGALSARQAADRAAELGIRLPYGTIAAYWSGKHGQPTAATLSSLARIVPFSEAQLQQAAWNVSAPLGPYVPPEVAVKLNRRQRAAVDELIRSMVADEAEGAVTDVETLAALLSKAAAAKGMSNRQIAENAGVSGPTVDRMMNGSGRPKVANVDAVPRALGIPLAKARRSAGMPAGARGPYSPPEESALLDERERRLVDEMIRCLVAAKTAANGDTGPAEEVARERVE